MPNAPLPLSQDPASFLASLISVQRDANQSYEMRKGAQDILIAMAHPNEDPNTLYMQSRPDLEDRINDDKRRGHL
jgi:hypothetical protein